MTSNPPMAPMAVNLRRLFPSASYVGCGDIRVTTASSDSRDCAAGSLFAALRGPEQDGHAYIADAVHNGAKSLLVEWPQADVRVPQCVVRNTRKAYAELTAALAGDPSRWMQLVGITGTNGKTTISWLVRSILQNAGRQCGLLGTIEYHDGLSRESSRLTTPDARTLSNWLQRMIRQRTGYAAMEISSHALEQDRVAGTWLDVAVISNITQDHLDYHGTFEAYKSSKLRIFERLKTSGLAVLNADDPMSFSCRSAAPHRVRTYGIEAPADFSAEILEENTRGSRFVLKTGSDEIEIHTPLIGRHNVSNCLAAVAATEFLGLTLEQGAQGIEALTGVPGRMERIQMGQPFDVFVDYAHTDDALRRAITGLQQLTIGRVIVVYGAGGDRDRSKRPLMGKAGGTADLVIVTSDNPRSEDPRAIIDEILKGYDDCMPTPIVEVDREQAIIRALREAGPDDCVLIAGKGHESIQIIGNEGIVFDDREVVRRNLARLRLAEVSQLAGAAAFGGDSTTHKLHWNQGDHFHGL
ncbi:MAG: UDP-N-acetylmuramoyl-L-alanyl-D-glutamate--2,6-diaminopimelate ligase [Planctomycetales bacterium]